MEENQGVLKGKLKIEAELTLLTGLHIGANSAIAPIGAVDSPFIRDPYTKQPVIPGNSLKGKIRILLVKSTAPGYILNPADEDDETIKRLFGYSTKAAYHPSRLQFFDIKLTPESFRQLDAMELDTYIGEIKSENIIDRITALANPRQVERVPAGAVFAFRLVYNIEDPSQVMEDMKTLAEGFQLLQMDYLGGHGSRGYGRVSLHNFNVQLFTLQPNMVKEVQNEINDITEFFEGCCAV